MSIKIPVYEAKIMGTDNTGIFAMSFVDVPANECNFVALKRSAARTVQMSLDKHKRILTGVVLVPDQLIYRNDTQLGEYYLKFTANDIEKIRDKMMRTGVALRTTTHQHEKPLRDNHLVECWIVANPKSDKAQALGLGELPKGTLVASYKIGNATYWQSQVLAGKVKGFSIEGLFNFKSVKMAKQTKPGAKPTAKPANMGLLAQLMRAIFLEGDTAAETKDLATVAGDDETGSGTPELIFTLQDGTEIDVDSEGFCTIEGEQAPAGEHTLADGNVIVISDDGMFVETAEEATSEEPAAAEATLTKEQKLARQKAKEKGRAKLAEMAKKNPNAAEIARLKAQIAKLEKEPSTEQAKPTVVATEARDVAKLKGHERAAIAIRERNARKA